MSEVPHKKFKQDKAKYYYKTAKKNVLQVGYKGFLASCSGHEKDCIRECYNILNDYANELYGPELPEKPTDTEENSVEKEEETDDIADVLNQEIKAIGDAEDKLKKKQRRFQQVDTGVNCCLFVRAAPEVNTTELAERIVADIVKTKKSKTRHLIRLTPVETVCSTNMADIERTAGKLFDQHFLKEPTSFSVMLKKRYNNSLRHEIVTKELASLVFSKNRRHKVDLRDPEKTVLVEVIRGLCCLSVVKGYVQNKKYNLIELAGPMKETKEEAEEQGNQDVDEAKADDSKSDVETKDANSNQDLIDDEEDNEAKSEKPKDNEDAVE